MSPTSSTAVKKTMSACLAGAIAIVSVVAIGAPTPAKADRIIVTTPNVVVRPAPVVVAPAPGKVVVKKPGVGYASGCTVRKVREYDRRTNRYVTVSKRVNC